MKYVNLTPHSITIMPDGSVPLTIPASGHLARCTTKTVHTGTVNGWIPITETEYGSVEGLPEPEQDTVYIVSALVAGRCKDRSDIFIPNESVRDDKGRIIGCKSLGRVR